MIVFDISFWCSNEFNGGQCEMKLRRLQQASFLPCTVENDKRQLQAQSQSRSASKSGISSGAFLVVLQLTMDIMLSPIEASSFSPLLLFYGATL